MNPYSQQLGSGIVNNSPIYWAAMNAPKEQMGQLCWLVPVRPSQVLKLGNHKVSTTSELFKKSIFCKCAKYQI